MIPGNAYTNNGGCNRQAAQKGGGHDDLSGQLVVAVASQRHGIAGTCQGGCGTQQDDSQVTAPESQGDGCRQGSQGGNHQPQDIGGDDFFEVAAHTAEAEVGTQGDQGHDGAGGSDLTQGFQHRRRQRNLQQHKRQAQHAGDDQRIFDDAQQRVFQVRFFAPAGLQSDNCQHVEQRHQEGDGNGDGGDTVFAQQGVRHRHAHDGDIAAEEGLHKGTSCPAVGDKADAEYRGKGEPNQHIGDQEGQQTRVKDRIQVCGIDVVKQQTRQQVLEGHLADVIEGSLGNQFAAANQGTGADHDKDRQHAADGEDQIFDGVSPLGSLSGAIIA